MGTPAVLAGWGRDSLPWMGLDGNGVVWKGTFYDRSPLQSLYAWYVQDLSLVRLMTRLSPLSADDAKVREKAMVLLAQVLRECSQATHAASPELQFYCVLYPKPCDPRLADMLRKGGVRVLDYTGLLGDYAEQVRNGLTTRTRGTADFAIPSRRFLKGLPKDWLPTWPSEAASRFYWRRSVRPVFD